MSKIVWIDKYATGIPEIDTQHKQIVDYLNQLEDAHRKGSRKGIEHVIEGMVDYTMSHFAFEEALMEQAAYPFALAHKSVHETFIKRVESFQERFSGGEDIAEELYGVLRRWLLNHIQRDDAAYVRAVKGYLEELSPEAEAVSAEPKGSWLALTLKKFFK